MLQPGWRSWEEFRTVRRSFFVKHQDRILFGTDCTPLGMGYHKIYYRFFETKDEYIFRISPKENFRDREDGQSTESDWKMRS